MVKLTCGNKPVTIPGCGCKNRSLGTRVTAKQYAAIASGNFDGLSIGDYWEINGITWRIADFDYWLNYGDVPCTTHHVMIVPDSYLLKAQLNSTVTGEGAYVGSDFYTGNNGNTARTDMMAIINGAFGSSHILSHREFLKNAITNGYESNGNWYDSTAELMTEEMVYGTREFKNILNGTGFPFNYTIDNSQLGLFRQFHSRICLQTSCWLRDISHDGQFCLVANNGTCAIGGAAYVTGIRPIFAIIA